MIRRSSELKVLGTSGEVIDALGGTSNTARIAASVSPSGCSPQRVTNWRGSGRLAPFTFLIFTDELTARGFRAPPELWGIKPPPERRR